MCRAWWEGQKGVGADVIVMKKRTSKGRREPNWVGIQRGSEEKYKGMGLEGDS